MGRVANSEMSDQRALLTDTERAILSGEKDVKDNYRYSVESRVRTRLRDQLTADVELLERHQPEMHNILVESVCGGVQNEDIAESGSPPTRRDPEASTQTPGEDRENTEVRATPEESSTEDPPTGGPDVPTEAEISDDVWTVVNEVSASWDDEPERLETRRMAAATVLQYALTHNVHLGKSSDVVEAIRERYPVEGQNAETWWRKNVRGVLKEVGTYSKGHHGYAVEDLPVNEGVQN